MPFATARDGTRLHYRVYDCTDPWRRPATVMLQHGFARSSKFWYGMIPYLCRHYRVVCPDLRGLGESGSDFDPDRTLSVETYLADIVTIIDHLGEDRIHYAGESLGGMVGFHLAVEHADRLRSFTAISTPPTVPVIPGPQSFPRFGFPTWQEALRTMGADAWSRAANGATRFPPDTDPALVDWYAQEGARCSVDVLVAMSRVIEGIDLKPLLPQVKVPVLGIYPTFSPTVSDEQMRLLRQVPNIRIVTLPIRYHVIWALKPAACATNMLYFIGQLDGLNCRE
jgi:3-oxoadipate enol-lactonase